MKLRFEKNSLRYRLRKSEVDQLKLTGGVSETVAFPGTNFTFELRVSKHVINPLAECINDRVIVSLPLKLATDWIDTDEVGIHYQLHVNQNETLDLLIEKDFPCKHQPENNNDTFTELAERLGK